VAGLKRCVLIAMEREVVMSRYRGPYKYPGILQCLQCKRILVSFYRHDYKTCGCPNETMVDGGHDYLRCGGKDMKKIKVLRITTALKRKK